MGWIFMDLSLFSIALFMMIKKFRAFQQLPRNWRTRVLGSLSLPLTHFYNSYPDFYTYFILTFRII